MNGGSGGTIQASPEEIQAAGSMMRSATAPLQAAGSTVAGAQAHVVGFAMTDAVNSFSAAWSASFAQCVSVVDDAASGLSSTGATYAQQEMALATEAWHDA